MPSSTTDPADRSHAGSAAPGRFLPGPRPRIIAHRGLALDGAENTLRAFTDAVAAGADMLETDTHASRDGVAFAVHDPDLRRLGAGDGRIRDLDADALRALRVHGEPLPTLAEVLEAFPSVPVNIDVKTPAAARPAAEAIAAANAAGRVCVTSFEGATARRAVREVRRLTGMTPMRSASRGTIVAFLLACAVGAPQRLIDRLLAPYGALQVPHRHRGYPVVSARTIAAAHRAGCEVHVWTIDSGDEMRELLALGADGIVTNRSDVLAAVLSR